MAIISQKLCFNTDVQDLQLNSHCSVSLQVFLLWHAFFAHAI